MNSRHILGVILVLFLFAGCAPTGYVKSKRVVVVKTETKTGSKTVYKTTVEVAATNVIEKGVNVQSVTKISNFTKKPFIFRYCS